MGGRPHPLPPPPSSWGRHVDVSFWRDGEGAADVVQLLMAMGEGGGEEREGEGEGERGGERWPGEGRVGGRTGGGWGNGRRTKRNET